MRASVSEPTTRLRTAWPRVDRPELGWAGDVLLKEGASIVLHGPAGVGKTSLADALLGVLHEQRGVHRVDLAASPAFQEIPLAVLGRLLDLAPALGARPSLTTVADALAELAQRLQPLVVCVDDAQWLDPVSAELLASLARSRAAQLVVTTRTIHSLPEPLTRLVREDALVRVDVAGLTRDQIQTLISGALDGPVDVEVARDLAEQTQGNALFVREAVRANLAAGTLDRVRGVWTWTGPRLIDQRLVDLVSADLSNVDAALRPALETVALAEPVRLSTIREHVCDAHLDELIALGWLRLEGGAGPGGRVGGARTVRMDHPLYAEAVRASLSPGRSEEVHAAIAAAVGDASRLSVPSLLRLTLSRLNDGLAVDPEHLMLAARAASGLAQSHVAIRLASEVIDQRPEPPSALVVQALLLRAWEYRFRDEPTEALADVELGLDALPHVEGIDTETRVEMLLALATLKADIVQYHHDDIDAAALTAAAAFSQARDLSGVDHHLTLARREAYDHAIRTAWAGDFAHVIALLPHLEDLDTRLPRWGLNAVAPAVLALTWRGEIDRALSLAQARIPEAADLIAELPWTVSEIFYCAYMALLSSGRVDDVRGLELPRSESEDHVTRQEFSLAMAGRGRFESMLGQWSDARASLRSAADLFALRDPSGLLGWVRACEVLATALSGSHVEALAALPAADQPPTRTSRALAPDGQVQLLRAAAVLGVPDVASRALRIVDWARANDFALIEVAALHVWGVSSPGDVPRLLSRCEELVVAIDAPVAHTMTAHLRAMAHADERTERHLRQRLAADHGVWVRGAEARVVLSPREHEVATLAAQGLSSEQIASRLALSTRTVDTHLGRVYAKLGIRKRGDLAGSLPQVGVIDHRRTRSPV